MPVSFWSGIRKLRKERPEGPWQAIVTFQSPFSYGCAYRYGVYRQAWVAWVVAKLHAVDKDFVLSGPGYEELGIGYTITKVEG